MSNTKKESKKAKENTIINHSLFFDESRFHRSHGTSEDDIIDETGDAFFDRVEREYKAERKRKKKAIKKMLKKLLKSW